ncbi:MAG: polyhydroxyalkanoic acid system family protein [Myxococcales bacterium]|nr:polyhydroxyalkanoic acid system family protein [Myxococcales bacterium]
MKLVLDFTHTIERGELKRRLEARAAHWDRKKPELGVGSAFRWTSDWRAEASARGGSGWMELGERQVRLEVELPFVARPFRARIEAFLRAEAEAVLSGDVER